MSQLELDDGPSAPGGPAPRRGSVRQNVAASCRDYGISRLGNYVLRRYRAAEGPN
jgi:hypothetical protein